MPPEPPISENTAIPGTTVPAPVLACPVCAEPLTRDAAVLRCGSGHLYDVAREGYVNLLLAQHRSSRDPGYGKEMIAGRRDFFDAGHYQPLADRLAALLLAELPDGADRVVLDAGCGEGYYLRRLRVALAGAPQAEHPLLCGLDISKHGIRVAARRDPDGLYAVASSYRMPVLSGRVDVLLSHFSPVDAADFHRVVRPGGAVVVSGPGPRHLFAFKRLLYGRPAEHEPVDSLAGDDRFVLVGTHRITHPLRLDGPGQVANLLGMTPFYWSVDPATRARLGALDRLDTEVDVVARVYRGRT